MKCLGGFPAVGDGSLLEEMGLKIWNIHTYALLKKDRLLYKLNYCNPPPKDDEPILTVFLMGWFVTCFYFKISQSLSLIIQLAQGGEGGGTYWHWLITPEIADTVIAMPLWYPDQKNDHDTFNLVPSLVPKETDWTSRAGLIRWVGKGWQWWNIFFPKNSPCSWHQKYQEISPEEAPTRLWGVKGFEIFKSLSWRLYAL